MSRRLLLLPLAAGLALGACGGDAAEEERADTPPAAGESAEVVVVEAGQPSGSVTELVRPAGTSLPEGYPQALVYPGAVLQGSAEQPESSGRRALAIWLIEAAVADILDFYEEAFRALGLPAEPVRFETEEFASLAAGEEEGGAAVLIEVGAGPAGEQVVTVSLLLGAGGAAAAGTVDAGQGELAPAGYPAALVYPGAVSEGGYAYAGSDFDGPALVAFWLTADRFEAILDFYEAAFRALGFEGEALRFLPASREAAALNIGFGPDVPAVVILPDAGPGGETRITVTYPLPP